MPARVRMGVTTTGGRTTCAARNALDAAGRDAARVRARPRISPTPPIEDLSFLFFFSLFMTSERKGKMNITPTQSERTAVARSLLS